MATEDRHLHKIFRDVAKRAGARAADIVANAKKAGLSKWTVWQYWNGKHTPLSSHCGDVFGSRNEILCRV